MLTGQVLRYALKKERTPHIVHLLFANRRERDILLDEKLRRWQATQGVTFHLHLLLSQVALTAASSLTPVARGSAVAAPGAPARLTRG